MTTIFGRVGRISWAAGAAALVLGCGGGEPVPPGLVEAVRDSLAQPARTFEVESRLVAWVDSLVGVTSDPETRSELELLRLRAVERVLTLPELQGYNPYADPAGRAEAPPGIEEWVNAHENEIAYSEPAGQWLVPTPVWWELYERYRDTRAAEEIAWEAANAGLPGECEGMIGCYLDVLTTMYGRYLEERPSGEHVEEAVAQVVEQLTLMSERTVPERPLCGNEQTTEGVDVEQLQQIRRALERVPQTTAQRDSALTLVGQLEQRCRAGANRTA